MVRTKRTSVLKRVKHLTLKQMDASAQKLYKYGPAGEKKSAAAPASASLPSPPDPDTFINVKDVPSPVSDAEAEA